MKYLGIDYGLKNVGIAISDEEGKLAFAKTVLDNDKNLIDKIIKIVKEENIEAVVMGESVNFDGQPNPVMEQIISFKKSLEEEISSPVYFQKELFTSAEADRLQGKNSKQVRKQDRREKSVNLDKNDASAAALILRSYLDNL